MHALARSILRFVYPPRCAGCDGTDAVDSLLCTQCDVKLAAIETAARCRKCSMPAAAAGQPCPHCRGLGLPPFGVVASLGTLTDPLKHIVHRGKYTGAWPMLEQLTDRLARRPQVQELLSESDLLVPVPLHRSRQIERGYNQADVIARRLGKVHKVPVHMAADRKRATVVQSQLHSRKKRVDNLREAFSIRDPRQLEGQRIVLVDDVLTTGSTMVYLARELLKANPVSVAAIVLAVADPHGREFEFI